MLLTKYFLEPTSPAIRWVTASLKSLLIFPFIHSIFLWHWSYKQCILNLSCMHKLMNLQPINICKFMLLRIVLTSITYKLSVTYIILFFFTGKFTLACFSRDVQQITIPSIAMLNTGWFALGIVCKDNYKTWEIGECGFSIYSVEQQGRKEPLVHNENFSLLEPF